MQRIDIYIGICVFVIMAVIVALMASIYWPYAVMFVVGCILVAIVAVLQEYFASRRKH